jgi:hypothetical protein
MSLVEFPLNLVTLPNVKIGLDRGNGRRALFPIPTKCGFVLNIHGKRSIGVKVVEGRRAGEPEELRWVAKGYIC